MKSKEMKVLVPQSCPTLCDPADCPRPFPGRNSGVGCHSLLQGIFPTQRSNPGLLHCRQILYHLSYQGNTVSYEVLLNSGQGKFSFKKTSKTQTIK